MSQLPEECWELIFKSIDYRFLESVSLVSTFFLSITNRLRSTFVITDLSLPFLPRLLLRFPNLTRIKFLLLNQHFNFNSILLPLSLSAFHFKSVDLSGMPYFPDFNMFMSSSSVTELNCSKVSVLRDSDLFSIGLSFPFLQKLDISYPHSPISDSAIISLSSSLKQLLFINISGNNFITDQSIISLSQNCPFLKEIIFLDCDFISSHSINFLLRNSQNLESFAINGIGLRPRESFYKDTFFLARCLSELDLSDSFLSDKLICLIADAKLPLKKLLLSNCHCITFDGIFYLLANYQTLLHLNLEGSSFLSDEMILELASFFRHLTYLNLSFCSKLTGLSFFAIIERCVSLKCMRMEGTNFGVEEEESSMELDITKSGIVKSLYLSRNNNLRDECLQKLSRHCPFVETLEVAHCPGITRDGIHEVLRNCGNLRCLNISRCSGINRLGVDFELPKLESLRAGGTWIDEEALDMISKRCKGLLHLDLEGCLNMKSRGLKEVVQRCNRLREINLKNCEVDLDGIVTWMVCVNPSLRKIVPPSVFFPTSKLRNFLMRHGCVICLDSSELLFCSQL